MESNRYVRGGVEAVFSSIATTDLDLEDKGGMPDSIGAGLLGAAPGSSVRCGRALPLPRDSNSWVVLAIGKEIALSLGARADRV